MLRLAASSAYADFARPLLLQVYQRQLSKEGLQNLVDAKARVEMLRQRVARL